MRLLLSLAIVVLAGRCSFAEEGTAHILVAGKGASNPSLALSGDGEEGYVVWVDMSNDEPALLCVRVSWADSVIGLPVRVNDISGDVDFHHQASPLVRVGPEGNIYVAWQTTYPVEGRMFPASNLKLARSTDGGASFVPSIFLNDDYDGPPTSHTFHGMDVGPDGSVYLSWIDGRRGEAAKGREKAWGEHDADAHERHHGHDGMEGPDIRVARSDDQGKSFGPATIVDSVACPCCRTAVTVGPRGEVYVSWRKLYPGNIRDIALSRSEDRGLSFAAAKRIHPDEWKIDGCPHHGPSLAVADDGEVHAVWYSGKEGASGSTHAISGDAGESFVTGAKIVYEGGSETSHPSIALLPGGDAVIASEEWDGKAQLVRVGLFNETQEEIFSVAGKFPSLSSSGETCAVAWLAGDSLLVRRLQIPGEVGLK